MKIAIAGKGGVGKTTISGSLCRLLGRRGHSVLAIDGDPNPNLAVVLGLSMEERPPISTDLLERFEEDGKTRVRLGLTIDDLVRQHAVSAPDDVALLMVGKPDHAGTGCMCGSHAVVREIVHAALVDSERFTVLDMEASLEHMKRGTARYVDVMYVIVEPYFRALEAARRIKALAEELGIGQVVGIANKVRSQEDERAIREYCDDIGLEIVAVVPFDEKILEAERNGTTLVDSNGSAPALDRIAELAENIARAS